MYEQTWAEMTNQILPTLADNEPQTTVEWAMAQGLNKCYKVLAKSVFRLNPGETGELHWQDYGYHKLSSLVGKRTYEKENIQIVCRVLGATTGFTTALPTSVWSENEAGLGKSGQHTAFVSEKSTAYLPVQRDDGKSVVYSNTLTGTGTTFQTIVHEDQAYEGKDQIED